MKADRASAGGARILTGSFVAVCAANFACFASFYFLLATLPIYVTRIGGNDSDVGLVIGVFAATALVVRPFVGRGSDSIGHKILMLSGAAVLAASGLLYILTRSVSGLLALRIFHGVGFAMFGTAAMAMIADISPAGRRGEAIGYYGASTNLAMVIGPAVGVLLMQRLGFTILFAASAGLALISFLVSLTLSGPHGPRHKHPAKVRTSLIERSALFPSMVLVLMAVTYAAILSFMPLLAEKRQIGNPGLFFTIMGVVILATRGPLGRISDRYGRGMTIVPGLLCMGLGLATMAYTPSLAIFLVVSFMYGLGFAAVQPGLLALSVDRAGPQARGAAMGTVGAAMDLGIGAGSFLWGFVSQAFGFTALYLAAAAAALAGVLIYAVGSRPTKAAPGVLGRWEAK
ncbi:MAG TPA: MFS transporter [Dehalococcoidia bacterium]|nr:MFS transporter [Dehalococcoidia bacterium]